MAPKPETPPEPAPSLYIAETALAQIEQSFYEKLDQLKVTWKDLIDSGKVPQWQNLLEFLKLRLEVKHSVVERAFESLLHYFPPPREPVYMLDIRDSIKARKLITKEEESNLRTHALGVYDGVPPTQAFRTAAFDDLVALNKMIIAGAAGHTLDTPVMAMTSDETLDLHAMLAQTPFVRQINGEQQFCLRLPAQPNSQTRPSFISENQTAPDNVLFVGDPEKNAMLTEFIQSHPALFADFLANRVNVEQWLLLTNMENVIAAVATKREEVFEQEAKKRNAPLEVKFLQLIEEYMSTHKEESLQFAELHRVDEGDAYSIDFSPLDEYELDLDSWAVQHEVRLDEHAYVEFVWTDQVVMYGDTEHPVARKGQAALKIGVVGENKEERVCIVSTSTHPAKEGEIVYILGGPKDQPNAHDPEVLYIVSLFSNLDLVTTDMLFDAHAQGTEPLDPISPLLSCPDLLSFFQQFRVHPNVQPYTEFVFEAGALDIKPEDGEKLSGFEKSLNELIPPRDKKSGPFSAN